MVVLSGNSTRKQIVAHLRQSVAAGSVHETIEVHIALTAIEQSYEMSPDKARAAIGAARMIAAEIAPTDTISEPLQRLVERRRLAAAASKAEWEARLAQRREAAAAKVAALPPADVAALPAQIAALEEKGADLSHSRGARKRARLHARDLRDMLAAAAGR